MAKHTVLNSSSLTDFLSKKFISPVDRRLIILFSVDLLKKTSLKFFFSSSRFNFNNDCSL